ncbi:MAG: GNAT family N-acetyltransferase [Candidatus Taylorbacteria bacterium]|nr:GNAT family N-acetyltransferase [Candidatus Taylorbacteria bacterium]
MKITIQNANPEDVLGNSEVFYYGWLDTYPNKECGITREDIEDRFKNGRNPEALEKKRKQIIELTVNEKLFNAKDGEKIVGVCRLRKSEREGELTAIYILSEYRGGGIGKMFWNEALKFFDNSKDIIVKVATYNTKAIEFYKKLGFSETGEVFSDENFRMKSGAVIPETKMVIKANLTLRIM